MLARASRVFRQLNSSATTAGLQRFSRHLTTSSSSNDGSTFDSPPPPSNGDEEDDDMFSEENVEDLYPPDVEKLKFTYELVKEHAEAVEKGIAQVDPSSNPIIDPRSFEIRRLPRLPKEVLEHFREELPPSVAERSKPVFTREIWEALGKGTSSELINESANVAAEWETVDQKTMTKHSLMKRGRAHGGLASQTGAKTQQQSRGTIVGQQRRKKKKNIKLRNDEGKIEVDLRAVATLNLFISETGRILPRRKTKLSAKSQNMVSKAIKRARCMALINPTPKGPTLAELAALHSPEELGVTSPFEKK